VDGSRFETEAQAAQKAMWGGGETKVSQLTDKARSAYVRGKKEVEPMYEQAMHGGGYDPRLGAAVRGENPYALHGSEARVGGGRNDGSDVGNLVGFRQHHGGQPQALTKGIAGAILDSVARPVKKTLVSAPFATDEALPTDPYASAHGGRSKDMFVENYRGGGSIPGFTGRR
jgi:hypothetical protein